MWYVILQRAYVQSIDAQSRRSTKASKRFFRKLLKGLCYVPRVIVTVPPAVFETPD